MYVLAVCAVVQSNNNAIAQTGRDTIYFGDWVGTIEFQGAKLKIVFHVTRDSIGTLGAKMDSPDQGAFGIATSGFEVRGDSVFIGVSSIGGGYEGLLTTGRDSLVGRWKQGGVAIDLNIAKLAVPLPSVTMNRPQEPKPPYPYRTEDVTFAGKSTGMTYTGTVTEPDSGGPFAAAILITGSGEHDRDETLVGHKPFKVIADYLTRRGIAVLRVDDRGIGGSSGDKMGVTSAVHAEDVLAELDYLKGRNDIDPLRIGLVGHSEGGVIAPLVASESKDVAFVVLLAGTGMTGSEIVVAQIRLIEEADSVSPVETEKETREISEAHAIVKSSADSADAAKRLRDYFISKEDEWGPGIKKIGGDPEKFIEERINSLLNPWFRFFITYDPRPALEKVKCPVLAMGGTLDLQVPAKENLKEIETALKKGGNKDYTIKLLPGLNHLFQHATTGSPKEYAQIEETFSPEALRIMGDWILSKTANK